MKLLQVKEDIVVAKEAGLEKVPAVVRQLNERQNDGVCIA